MSEERYVVRDKDGDLCWRDDDGGLDWFKRREYSRTEALRLAAEFDEYNHDGAPHRLHKVKEEPKPKAPLEVFVALCDGAPYAVDTVDEFRLGSRDRVVRYVLAEGEK